MLWAEITLHLGAFQKSFLQIEKFFHWSIPQKFINLRLSRRLVERHEEIP